MSDFKGLFAVRDGLQDDNNFVLSTFKRGLYYGDSWFSLIPKDVFMANYGPLIDNLIANPTVVIKIACLPEDPNVILGYVILSGDYQTVHWIFVKKMWRGKGIGTSLMPKHPTTFTHLSAIGKTLMVHYKEAVFNPFKL